MAVNEWHPARTAPKDGRWFLCLFEGTTMPVHCRYEQGKGFQSYVMPQYSPLGNGDFPAAHWMPLPAPPKEAV